MAASGTRVFENPGLWRTMARRPAVLIALAVFVLILLSAVFASQLAPADPARMSVRARLIPPAPNI
ncbi:hypothetical protein [Paracoccus cavernae]|uniref:hypothetical protein n=1 Tax=Paracoccus cavernae TaxID=1571207 RepID=UPI0036369E14